MKQILQNLGSGETTVAEIPSPQVTQGRLLIRTTCSLMSAGTERMLVEFSRGNVIEKARQQPEKVRQVLDKVRTDGLLPTVEAVRSKLDQPLPLGYCNVGTVIAVGEGVAGFSVGDRVASNGPHAEIVSVPQNLCARIPEGVDDSQAAFTVLGAIGLQGIRLAAPTLGETFAVAGLGLIGLLTVQLLHAQGCRVLGIDMDPTRLALARALGAETVDLSRGEDPVAAGRTFSGGRGIDGAIITAATKSSEPVSQAARMCRKRGRIVMVGVTGMELNRSEFYEKELTFQVSCSYGPGRYDPQYEDKGQDYPVGFVRWTEQRNFEAVLGLLAAGRIDVSKLISHRFPIEQAVQGYDQLIRGSGSIGILLEYAQPAREPSDLAGTVPLGAPAVLRGAPGKGVLGFIGAGNYAGRVLIPAFRAAGARLKTVASMGGVSAVHNGRKLGFEAATTDTDSVFQDPEIDTVVITTRHDSHAHLVREALEAGKHVFTEKPLCLTLDQLSEIETAYDKAAARPDGPRLLMVGFNRRFAPQLTKMKTLLESLSEPKVFVMTINAGPLPPEHWIQDRDVGGGRIIGECCHFIDLMRFLAAAPIEGFEATMMGRAEGVTVRDDKASITLRFADGSFGTVHYLANGHAAFPKERIEVFAGGRVLQLDNFRRLKGFGWPGFRRMALWRQDKGQAACAEAFLAAVRGQAPVPIPFDELSEGSRVSIEIAKALRP